MSRLFALLPLLLCTAVRAEGREVPAPGNAWHVALADADGDGVEEVFTACYDGLVGCQSPDGKVLWSAATGAFPYDLSAADLDGDGRAEALVASADGCLHVIGAGRERWKWSTPAPLYQVEVTRLDGRTVILTGGVDRKLYALDHAGHSLKVIETPRVVRLIESGDLDGDGQREVVTATHLGELEVFAGLALTSLWKRRTPLMENGREVKGFWRPYSLALADLDGDGRDEILLGSGFYNRSGIRVLKGDGSVLWDRPDGFYFRDGTYYSHTQMAAADIADSPGKEVLGLNAGRLHVLTAAGEPLVTGRSVLGFTDLALAGGRGPGVWLASTPNGDDRIYRLDLTPGWEQDFAGLKREGRMARVEANLDRLRDQIAAWQGVAPDGPPTIHLVSGGQPNTPELIRAHFPTIAWYRQRYPYPNCIFAMSINIAANEPVPGFGNPDRRTLARRLRPAAIVELLKTNEEAGIPFIAAVGHGCEPQVTVETCEAILKACPKTCLGFNSSENSDFGEPLEKYLNDYWFPLMDVCRRYGKQALLIEKGAWWLCVPAMDKYRKLIDGTYADVLVMSVEDSNSRSPELNLLARAGLYAAGAVNTWSARTISDELCWNRYFEWEWPQSGHPFLRRELAQALLGARFFEYHLYLHRLDDPEGPRITTIGREVVDLIIPMIGKGLLIPPRPADMVGLAPVALRMREPDPGFAAEAMNFHRHDEFADDPAERSSLLEGVACHHGMAPVREHYLGKYLLGQDRHYGNFVPATPYGVPLLVPASLPPDRLKWARQSYQTDGRALYADGRTLDGPAARPIIEQAFREAARSLPVRAEGRIELLAQRLPDGRLRLTLIDPGFLDPEDRPVVLRLAAGTPTAWVDPLSGETLTATAGAVRLTVPAGAFRIVESTGS